MKDLRNLTDYEREIANPPYRWLQIAIVWVVWIGAAAFIGPAITAIVIGIVASIKGGW